MSEKLCSDNYFCLKGPYQNLANSFKCISPAVNLINLNNFYCGIVLRYQNTPIFRSPLLNFQSSKLDELAKSQIRLIF
jgi:hypothetical protein